MSALLSTTILPLQALEIVYHIVFGETGFFKQSSHLCVSSAERLPIHLGNAVFNAGRMESGLPDLG
jgi:hypothetical protein